MQPNETTQPASTLRAMLLLGAAFGALAVLGIQAWGGALGLPAIALLLITMSAFHFGRKFTREAHKSIITNVAKIGFTVVGFIALLRHPIPCPPDAADGCSPLPVYQSIAQYSSQVDGDTFITYALIAMGIKFIGVLASAFAWHLLLVGQGIRFPYWQTIVTSFLIGRFIGTFLPSTIGLDGYTLYEAGKYSNQWPRAITAKALEKFIGVTGLFLGMVLTLPFGYSVIESVVSSIGKPDAATSLAGAIFVIAGGVSLVVIVGLVRPGLLTYVLGLVGSILPGRLKNKVTQFTDAVQAYEGKLGLLLLALASKFVTHFTTAVVYFFTALAIGVVGAEFWPVVFGSTIQILATLLSPTIAGEGAREAFQALLLRDQLGGVAPAVLSGALGFIAAEAATLWGGAFLWVRTPQWRPRYALVDNAQVSYEWMNNTNQDWKESLKSARAE